MFGRWLVEVRTSPSVELEELAAQRIGGHPVAAAKPLQ
jgi:hypothetical protein